MQEAAVKSVEEPQIAEPVKVQVVNDSSEGLARMQADLEPLARRVRSAACTLFLVSLLFCGSLEGMFGLAASCSILVFAAPGSLGTAYASRCAGKLAIFAAVFAAFNFAALSAFSVIVLPEVPHQVANLCAPAPNTHGKLPKPAAIDLHDILLSGHAFAATPGTLGMSHAPHNEKPQEKHAGHHLLGEDPATYPPMRHAMTTDAAQLTAAYSSKAARKLQQVVAFIAPETAGTPTELAEHCDHMQSFFSNTAPTVFLGAAMIQLSLFIASMSLAKRAGLLVRTARHYGANAI